MAINLYKKGTGVQVKVSEYGFEHSLASGEYFLTKEEALNVEKVQQDDSGVHDLDDNREDVAPVAKAKKGPKSKKASGSDNES